MERPLAELRTLKKEHDCPVLCSGDVFDHWKSPPELINFAIDALPKMFAIPGQHDLPCHSYEDRRKSAFQTLVSAKRITLVEPGEPINIMSKNCELVLHGFPWGTKVERHHADLDDAAIHVALVHEYIWTPGCSYQGAPKQSHVAKFREVLLGFHAAFFGDNHLAFHSSIGRTNVINCGGFYRRKIDEIKNRPRVWLLKSNCSVSEHCLDVSMDRFIDIDAALAPIEKLLDMGSFLAELASLGDAGLNFVQAVKQFIVKNGIDERIRKIIAEALHGRE